MLNRTTRSDGDLEEENTSDCRFSRQHRNSKRRKKTEDVEHISGKMQ